MKVQEGPLSAPKKHRPLARLLAGGLVGLASAISAAAELDPKDVLSLSPEDLSRLQVTSVSRRPELLSQAAASVYVITAEDIRRSAATTLTEALRLAPTLFVGFDNGIPGYVSSRGQASAILSGNNKLLVLIDGRSVYSPFFAGVLWDAQTVVLPDIERIEVINGPAGVLWGVNAVNGVINIITKNAAQTQGALASVGAGDRARDGLVRYGSTLGDSGHYRLYGQSSTRAPSIKQIDGTRVDDSWRKDTAGGRMDWQRGADAFSAQFNALSADQGQPGLIVNTIFPLSAPFPRAETSSFNTLGRWSHAEADGGNLAVQMYLDHVSRRMQPTLNDSTNILDLEVQKNEAPRSGHKLAWGGNIRFYRQNTWGSVFIGFTPEDVTQRWLSLFVQDEYTIDPSLRLTAGARIERGPYGTTDFLPSLRLAKQTGEGQLLWGGLSRTARGPTRLESDFSMPSAAPSVFQGTRNLRSERIDVAEIGYRYQSKATIASLTLFKNFYDGLTAATDPFAPGATFPVVTGNFVHGQATGIEAWIDYRINADWRVTGGFTASTDQYAANAGVATVPLDLLSGTSPRNTLQLRSSWNLPYRTELDVMFRHVSRLGDPDFAAKQSGNYYVPAYDAIDIRLGWKVNKQLTLDVIGQNLFGTDHAEFGDPAVRAVMAKRIYTRLTWRQ